jgi:hypothetical protein
MKRILITLFIALTSFVTKSQDFYKVSEVSYETYRNEKWNADQTTYPENMFLIMEGSTIKITDASNSKYVTYGKPTHREYSTHTATWWNAYDNDGKSCIAMIKASNDNRDSYFVCFMYDKYMYSYVISYQSK